MKEEKTMLEQIKEQIEKKMTRAIVEAIEDGAKIERGYLGAIVDGVFLAKDDEKRKTAVVLTIDAPEIDALFEETEQELSERAEKLRAELTEIENKLKSK